VKIRQNTVVGRRERRDKRNTQLFLGQGKHAQIGSRGKLTADVYANDCMLFLTVVLFFF
jgi:hypothetical protein